MFCEVYLSHETLLCSSFVSFEAVKGWLFLNITVYCEVQATKRCNAQKHQLFTALKLMKHSNAQKFPNFTESAPGLAIDARILEFLECFEHYMFREFQGWKALHCFVRFMPRNTVMLQKNSLY